MTRLPLAIAFSLLTACGRFPALPFTSEPRDPTLADLQPVLVDESVEELPQATLAELAAIYTQVLSLTEDPAMRLAVMHRLADIEMLEGEATLTGGESKGNAFATAIAAYETLLSDNPDNPRNDQLLYQLSKAYELNGDNVKSLALLEQLSAAYPQSIHVLESDFRRAESYFVAADYARAEAAYASVIGFGERTAYYTKAQYMRGWSRFKLRQYKPSIGSFTATLDQLVPRNNRIDKLPRGERELVDDCLRVLAVVFSYLDGAETIASAYDQIGVRYYQHLLYEALGEHYLSQERYRDSAETYKAFTRKFPESNVAHLLQLRVVESYEAGGFPDLIVAEKQHYVDAFGVGESYWLQSTPAIRDDMRPKLKLFIRELASYYHALAQQKSRKGKSSEQAIADYRQAGNYYQLFVDSFPRDPEVPAMGFLLGESRFEAGDYRAAIDVYEWVAYRFRDYDRASDAAYAAILAYGKIGDSDVSAAAERIDSELKFAAIFSADARAPAVLNHAANTLLAMGEYAQAITAATTLTRRQPAVAVDVSMSAWLIIGHSYFELQRFQDAEAAYQSALLIMPPGDKRREATVDRVAASIYKQAEDAVASGHSLLAAEQFSRVVAIAPQSKISVNAQFDAADHFMRGGEYGEANRLLIDFRKRYPAHVLSASIAAKLVSNYEHLQMWSAAAAELDGMQGSDEPEEQRRQALYLAAQYYDKSAQSELAIVRYRSYAHNWPAPMAIRMEAMNRLAELYQRADEQGKRRFWLKKIIATHAAAGADQSERSLYLAAQSASVFADDEYQAFERIKLRHPIKRSLKKKKSALERALAANEKTNDYGVARFSTHATFRMAAIYQQMSRDLLNSERPSGLDALALEQYELLLEEQAYPFEEKAIAIHESNARRSWDGIYDRWVRESFVALGELLPGRYSKSERITPSGAGANRYPTVMSELEFEDSDSEPDSQRIEDAKAWFRARMAKDSEDLSDYNRYGIFLRKQGLFAQAERVYLDALAISELDANTHRNIGILYDLYLGYQEKALQHFYRYRELTGAQDRAVEGWIADLERQLVTLAQGS